MSQFGLEYSEKSCLSCKLTLEPSTLPGPYPNIITIQTSVCSWMLAITVQMLKLSVSKLKKNKKKTVSLECNFLGFCVRIQLLA